MIRDATAQDATTLTEIAFSAKKYWNYPDEYYERWADELTISEQYICSNVVRCHVLDAKVVGFYSVVHLPQGITFSSGYMEPGHWLDHMFIRPDFHKMRIGSGFFHDLRGQIENELISTPLRIFVDPKAVGFYEKMGARWVRTSGSSIPGRTIPVYSYTEKGGDKFSKPLC